MVIAAAAGVNQSLVGRALGLARIDWAPSRQQPPPGRMVLATAVAIVGSLLADAILVAIGTAAFPATAGYGHFRFDDYAKLTVIGHSGVSRRGARLPERCTAL
jgi:hypothetical protein